MGMKYLPDEEDDSKTDSWHVVQLKTYISPEDVIGDGAFAYMGMNQLELPHATTIGQNAFIGCTSLEKIELPEAITIGNGAFMACARAASISIPKATTVGFNAFSNCQAAESIEMPKVETIGYNAFSSCCSVQSISIPKATQIGENAFRGCESVVSFEAYKLSTIGDKAFWGCTSLKEVVLPQVNSMGEQVFHGCSSLTTLDLPQAEVLDDKFFGKKPSEKCTSLKYLNLRKMQVANIPNNVFNEMDNLTCVNLSSIPVGTVGVRRGDWGLVASCDVLCSNTMSTSKRDVDTTILLKNEEYHEVVDGDNLIQITGFKNPDTLPTKYELYDPKVGSVDADAFNKRGKEKLVWVYLPGALDIQARAFKNCSNLKQIRLPRIWQPTRIKSDAFANCPNLKYLDLGMMQKTHVEENMDSWGIKNTYNCTILCLDGIVVVGNP